MTIDILEIKKGDKIPYHMANIISKGALMLHVLCPKRLIVDRNLPPAEPQPWLEKFAIDGNVQHAIFQRQLQMYVTDGRYSPWKTIVPDETKYIHNEMWLAATHGNITIHGYIDSILFEEYRKGKIVEFKSGKEKPEHHIETVFYMFLSELVGIYPTGASLVYSKTEKSYEYSRDQYDFFRGVIEMYISRADFSFLHDIWPTYEGDACRFCRWKKCDNHPVKKLYKRRKRCPECLELSYGVKAELGVDCALCGHPLRR